MSTPGNTVIDALAGLWSASPQFSRMAGAMLITAIWQGAVVAACLTICLKLTTRTSAALRFIVWAAGFFTVAGLPFLPPVLHWLLPFGPDRAAHANLNTVENAHGAWLHLDVRWGIALTVLWAVASLIRIVDLAAHFVRLYKLWKSATPVALHPIPLPGRRPVQVCTTTALDRPSVIGFFAPRILIPEWLFAQLTPGELDQIMLHETEHLRRGDDWTNLLQKLSLIVFPLNPALLWIERRLCLEREMACDEAVVHATGAPRAYAQCLTTLAERGLQRRAEALSLGVWQGRPELVRRVHSILRNAPALGPAATRGVLAAMTCGLVLGSVELSRCPQLVAFNAALPKETTQLPAMSRQFAQRTPAALVNASFAEPAKASLLRSKPYLTELKATMPAQAAVPRIYSDGFRQVPVKAAIKAEHPATDAAMKQSKPKPGRETTPDRRPRMLQANMTAPEPEPQSWLVLTAWEEVSGPSQPSSQETAQADAPADDATQPAIQAAQAPAQPGTANSSQAQPSAQVTVRQLVLRVIPVNSTSTSPTAISIRGSWLVIQL